MKTVKKEKNNRFQKFQNQSLSKTQTIHLKGGGDPPTYKEEWGSPTPAPAEEGCWICAMFGW